MLPELLATLFEANVPQVESRLSRLICREIPSLQKIQNFRDQNVFSRWNQTKTTPTQCCLHSSAFAHILLNQTLEENSCPTQDARIAQQEPPGCLKISIDFSDRFQKLNELHDCKFVTFWEGFGIPRVISLYGFVCFASALMDGKL